MTNISWYICFIYIIHANTFRGTKYHVVRKQNCVCIQIGIKLCPYVCTHVHEISILKPSSLGTREGHQNGQMAGFHRNYCNIGTSICKSCYYLFFSRFVLKQTNITVLKKDRPNYRSTNDYRGCVDLGL